MRASSRCVKFACVRAFLLVGCSLSQSMRTESGMVYFIRRLCADYGSPVSAAFRVLFLVGFISLGVKALSGMNLQALIDTGPNGWGAPVSGDAITDAYFRTVLRTHGSPLAEVPRPSASVQSSLAGIQGEGAILVISPRDDHDFILIPPLLSYLSWPRPVHYQLCGYQETADSTSPPVKVAAVIFHSLPPPAWMAPGRVMIPSLTLVPVSETAKKWTSYCSP